MQELVEDQLRLKAHEQATQIAIDGPAASGKSTVGMGLSDLLHCSYLDTGLMYRAVTWLALEANVSPTDEAQLSALARSTSFGLLPSSRNVILVNQRAMGVDLRTPRIDAHVSAVSAHPSVRSVLVARQREMADATCIVMVGRDIGTIVLPDATVKLWITASAHMRARRRFDEGLSTGDDSVERISAEIEARDLRDTNRASSPLRRAKDAVDLVTDALSPSQAVREAARIVSERIRHCPSAGSGARR